MLSQLSKQLIEDIQALLNPQEKAKDASQIKAIVEAALKRCNLVTREEFDAQQAVLRLSREKIESLEAQIAELEKRAI